MTYINSLLPIAGFMLGLLTTLSGVLFYYRNGVQKKYAAERDFQHLRKNQEQIVHMLTMMDDDLDDLKAELIRLSAIVQRPH